MHRTGTRTALTGALMLRLAGGLLLAPAAAWDPGNRTGIDCPRARSRGPKRISIGAGSRSAAEPVDE